MTIAYDPANPRASDALIDKLEAVRTRRGMFLWPPDDFDSYVNFLHGMDVASDGCVTTGFDAWLMERFDLNSSPLGWPFHIKEAFEQSPKPDNPDLFDFLFEMVIAYRRHVVGSRHANNAVLA